ncbi:MAG: hypothetical protein R3324_02140 [Halobacteriales archaeon]|nr:hypothetical protein [Halobacteriales archaeon]
MLAGLTPGQRVTVALGLYVAWTALTWLLEGRILTFLRPEATMDRLIYTGVTNLVVGTLLALWVVGRVLTESPVRPPRLGLQSASRTVMGVTVAGLLGLVMYVAQGPPTSNPVVVMNAFAQVLPVSIAEVVVCWMLVGSSVEAWLRDRGTRSMVAILASIFTSSVLFGLYHLAHSPPFNSPRMIALLTVVGVGTGAFYFGARTFYGALVFHNFMALFGVTAALAAAGQLGTFGRPVLPLIATATVALFILVGAEHRFIRSMGSGDRNSS